MLSRDGPVHDVRDTDSTRGSAMATRSLRAHCGIPACARPFGPMIADSSPVRVEFACDESGAPTRVELLQPGPLQELSPIPHALPPRPLQWVAEALSGYDWVGPELQQGILRSLIGQACLTPSIEGWAHAIHFAADQVSGCMPTTCPADIRDSLLSGMAFRAYILYWKHKQEGATGPEWHRFARALRDLCCLHLVVFEAQTHTDKDAFDEALRSVIVGPCTAALLVEKDVCSQFHQAYKRLFLHALQAFSSNSDLRRKRPKRQSRTLRLQEHISPAALAPDEHAKEASDLKAIEHWSTAEQTTEVCYVAKPEWLVQSDAATWLNAHIPYSATVTDHDKLQTWQAGLQDLLTDMSKWAVEHPTAKPTICELAEHGARFAEALRECQGCLESRIPFE